jgi:hypothetical protein
MNLIAYLLAQNLAMSAFFLIQYGCWALKIIAEKQLHSNPYFFLLFLLASFALAISSKRF